MSYDDMPTVPVYVKEKIYRLILAEADRKNVAVSTWIARLVEDRYEQKALQAKGEKIRPGVRE